MYSNLEYCMLFIIVFPCVFTFTSRYVYLAIYSSEMIIKIIAKGFIINKFSYLRNMWNILDFLVVLSAFATIIVAETSSADKSQELDLDFLRTFRVLRAIKTISILPGLCTIQSTYQYEGAFRLIFIMCTYFYPNFL